MKDDYEYLCMSLAAVSNLHVRIYQGDHLLHQSIVKPFNPDLVQLVWPQLNQTSSHVVYADTPECLSFGAIKVPTDDILIIIGPTTQIRPGKDQLTSILRRLGEPFARLNELADYFALLPSYSIERFIHLLCLLNFLINGEKLSATNFIEGDSLLNQTQTHLNTRSDHSDLEDEALHNTYNFESTLLSYIRTGNPIALINWLSHSSTGPVGKIAPDELRQRRNTFICAATLASRAAIEGGIEQETAFRLSDFYIQKAEMITGYQQLSTLTLQMLTDYAERVGQLHYGDNQTKLTTAVMRYIHSNIQKRMTIAEIAHALHMNRTHLCEKFKSETGHTIGAVIAEQKIAEAKRLLLTTEQSIVQISENLGFSSQGYFQNVFRNLVGMTPNTYRKSGR